jgi:pilus assembly protein CpaF
MLFDAMTMYTESLRAFLRPVLAFLDDDDVAEILINGPTDVWIERKGRLEKTDVQFSEEGLLGAARNMAQFVGRPLTDERPRLDARLPDGSRIHVVLPPIARQGATVSIRKFFRQKPTLAALVGFGSISEPMARLLTALVCSKLNTIVAGGTSSGKTTLLNMMGTLVPDNERLLTIEDSAELQIQKPHLVALETRPPDKNGKGAIDMGDLLHSALRLRPDRIVVGEVRGGEAFHLVQAMNTGHGGSLATTHANTPRDTLRRIESLCLMSAVELPLVAVRAQVASALQVVVCCERLGDGSRKVTHIAEVLPLNEKGEYRTQDLFVFTPVAKGPKGETLGYHAPTGVVPTFLEKLRAEGFTDMDELFFDPKTYALPPPPAFHAGEDYTLRWAPSLKHREQGQPDPEAFHQALKELEAKLKRSAAAPAGPSTSAPLAIAKVPSTAAATGRPMTASPAGPARIAAPQRPVPSPGTSPRVDDDKTPPPTRNPLSRG